VTNRVVYPQLWPHSELSLSYVSANTQYDDLTMAEFVAGYTAILALPSGSQREKDARLEHLNALMYLATQFTWPIVRNFHAAVLFEIERGRAKWGDSFTHLEHRMLHKSTDAGRSGSASNASPRGTFFLQRIPRGSSQNSGDHYGLIRNERKWLQHICGTCWSKDRNMAKHS